MGMCPYCGEDVPADSKSCWKCGTELSGGDDDDGGAGDGDAGSPASPKIEQRRKKAEGPSCPYCGAIVTSPKALRCNDCGRPIKDVNIKKNWVPAVFGAFGLVLLGLLVWLGYTIVTGGVEEGPDEGRDDPIAETYPELSRIYGGGGAASRQQAIWEDKHEGKFVLWEMQILKIKEDQSLALGLPDGQLNPRKPEVLLTFKDPETTFMEEELNVGYVIRFSGRLDQFKGKTLYVSLGLIEE